MWMSAMRGASDLVARVSMRPLGNVMVGFEVSRVWCWALYILLGGVLKEMRHGLQVNGIYHGRSLSDFVYLCGWFVRIKSILNRGLFMGIGWRAVAV